jgi:hypothetical protein
LAFRCRPVFLVVSGLNFLFSILQNIFQELSKLNFGGSLVCPWLLCCFLNLPITADIRRSSYIRRSRRGALSCLSVS